MAEKVVVQLVLDTSRYTSNAQKAATSTGQIQQSVDKTSKSMGSLKSTALKAGAALGAAFAAKAVLDFAKSSIAAFSNLEESVNAVTVVYGKGAEGIAKLGENSAESFGLSTRAVNDAAVAMSAFAEKIDEADPPGAFKNVLQRATDFASVMNLEVDEALRLFQSGLAGESEPLRKFGIDVSAATVTAVGLAAGLGDANGKLSEGEKVQARYLAIMEQTEKVTGDFANTSESLANRQKTLGAQWEEMQAQLGKKLAPAMTKLLEAGTKLIPVFGLIVDLFGAAVIAATPWIDSVVALADGLGKLADSTSDAEDGGRDFAEVMERVGQALQFMINPAGAGALAISELENEFVELSDTLGEAQAAHIAAAVAADRHQGMIDLVNQRAGQSRLPQLTTQLDLVATGAGIAADAFQAQADAIRDSTSAAQEAANPALALFRAQEKVVAAEKALRGARVAGKSITEDVIAATADLIAAELERDAAAVVAIGTYADGAAVITEYGDASIATAGEVDALKAAIAGIPTTRDIAFTATFRGFERLEFLLGGGGGRLGDTGDRPRARRHGGPVGADEPFIVGEAGPELFVPDTGGRIVPAGRFGSGDVNITVNQPTTQDLAADLAAGLIAGQVVRQMERVN